jgi:hypothetical protein
MKAEKTEPEVPGSISIARGYKMVSGEFEGSAFLPLINKDRENRDT